MTILKNKTAKTLSNLLDKSNYKEYSFVEEFNNIIENNISGYNGKTKEQLKSFFEDLQHGGCISGLISDFVYNHDCKTFYISHIDDLEDFKIELEQSIGEAIKGRNSLPNYTFLCWLCFEEYCYDLYNSLFEN